MEIKIIWSELSALKVLFSGVTLSNIKVALPKDGVTFSNIGVEHL